MTDPPIANLFIITEQEPITIHDAGFGVDMNVNPTKMFDWPGTFHNFSSMWAFADGHSEIHKWRDSRTWDVSKYFKGSGSVALIPQGSPDNPDLLWIQQRTSAKYSR